MLTRVEERERVLIRVEGRGTCVDTCGCEGNVC